MELQRQLDGATTVSSVKQERPYVPDTKPKRRAKREVTERPGQAKFRRGLLKRDGACVLTGVTDKKLLIAAHIKPYHLCKGPEEYNDLDNGFVLRADLHTAFDYALFSVEDDGTLIFRGSSFLPFGTRINGLTEKQREYLAGHRKWFLAHPPIHERN